MIGQFNTQSIYAKHDMLESYLANNDMSVILLSETWIRENKAYSMRGYRLLSKARGDGFGGVAKG